MRGFNPFWILVFSFLARPGMLPAQQKATQDTAWQSIQIARATKIYKQQFSGVNSPVYHGYQYVPFIIPAVGNSFYPSGKWHQGSVDFKGKIYRHLSLLYDAKKDQLVLQSADKLYWILLDKKKVGWFMLDSLLLINIRPDDTINNHPSAGYYEQLVDGNIRLLAKRKKTIAIPTTSGLPRSFRSQNIYYIKKGDKYYKVRTRHSVLKVLSDQKRAIRRYLRKNKIYFNNDREYAIKQAVIFYNKAKANGS